MLTDGIAEDESTRVPGIGTHADHPVSRKLVCEILRARGMELLELVKDQIWRARENERLIAGVVLTGGGSVLDGMWELTEEVLGMPVRQGIPLGVQGLTHDLSHPVYATAIGLAKFAAEEIGLSKKSLNRTGNNHWFFNRILSWVGN